MNDGTKAGPVIRELFPYLCARDAAAARFDAEQHA